MPETTESKVAVSFKAVKLTNRRYYLELSKTLEKETGDKKKVFLKMVHGQEADIPDDATPLAAFGTIAIDVLTHLAMMENLAESRHFTKDLTNTTETLAAL